MQRKFFQAPVILMVLSLLVIPGFNSNYTIASISKSSNPDNGDFIFQQEVNETVLPDRPILSIEKTINSTVVDIESGSSLVRPNQWVKVNLTIKNVGNKSAYNLTIVDPDFGEWASSSLNLTVQNYVQVDVNATIFYFYYFKPIREGNFTIEATEITYYDINSTEYRAISQRFVLLSIELESESVLDKDLWLRLLYYSLIILAIVGGATLIDFLILRKPWKRDTRKTTRKPTKQPKSKKQQKRKIKKRR